VTYLSRKRPNCHRIPGHSASRAAQIACISIGTEGRWADEVGGDGGPVKWVWRCRTCFSFIMHGCKVTMTLDYCFLSAAANNWNTIKLN